MKTKFKERVQLTSNSQRVEPSGAESRIPSPDTSHISFIIDPSPALMLSSCLVLGCAVSSFAFRRQENDRYQTVTFLIAIGAASAFGLVKNVEPNVIMLGLTPWALCIAMILISCFSWLMKGYKNPCNSAYCEKYDQEILLPY